MHATLRRLAPPQGEEAVCGRPLHRSRRCRKRRGQRADELGGPAMRGALLSVGYIVGPHAQETHVWIGLCEAIHNRFVGGHQGQREAERQGDVSRGGMPFITMETASLGASPCLLRASCGTAAKSVPSRSCSAAGTRCDCRRSGVGSAVLLPVWLTTPRKNPRLQPSDKSAARW